MSILYSICAKIPLGEYGRERRDIGVNIDKIMQAEMGGNN